MHRKTAVVFAGILLVISANKASGYTIMGDITSYTEDAHEITFNCINGKVRLGLLTDNLLRVHMTPSGEFPPDELHLEQNGPYFVANYTWPGVRYELTQEPSVENGFVYTIKAGKVVVKVTQKPFRMAFYDADGNLLVAEKTGVNNAGLGYAGARVYETMHLPDDEHFFGFGAHNHPLDMRGRRITCTAAELQTTNYEGGFPVPFFMSTRGYGIFFNNLDDNVRFEMGTTPHEYSFRGGSGEKEGWDMDYYLIYGPRFEDVLKRYTDIVGRPMLPVKWFFGHIFMECCQWKAQDVIDVARKFRAGDWPCDALIIDCQAYYGIEQRDKKNKIRKQDWDNDTPTAELYSKQEERIETKHGMDWAEGFGDTEAMFRIVKKLGFKTIISTALQGPELYNWPSYDPTVKANLDRYWEVTGRRTLDGIDSWRQDNSEKYPAHTGIETFANGYESHNLFGGLWAKNVVEKLEAMGLYGRPVISRGGPIAGHRYIIPWPGDLPHGLNLLWVDLNWVRNGGLAAYPYTTVNLGGWGAGHGQQEQNLIRRVINVIPLVPISQLVGWGKEGENAMLAWEFSKPHQDLFRYYLKLRYRLHPYIYSAALEAHQTARPILAALVLDYQNDPNTYDKGYHFMLGRQLLAAPVLDEVDRWRVYLPEGTWIHYWTGRQYDGNQTVTVEAALYGRDGLPMFVKSGAIIAMMPEMSYIYEKARDPLTLDIYPPKTGSARHIMYDCQTVKSPVTETIFECSQSGEKIEICISASDVAYELWVHCNKEPAAVIVDSHGVYKLKDKYAFDKAKKGWYYGAGCFYGSDEIETLNIKLPKTSKRRFVEIRK